MKKILGRAITVLPAVLLQAVWLFALFRWLAPWAGPINLALSVLAVIFVLYLITKQDEGTYKILWLLVILVFPLAGALLYLIFGNKRTAKPLRKKLEKTSPLPADTRDGAQAMALISSSDKRLAQTFGWVERLTGSVTTVNRSAKYYPLGDLMFPDMLSELKKAEKFIFVEYFIIEKGEMWDEMVKIMAEKAAEGVDVRVMYDDLGSISTYTSREAEELRKKGIRCVPFNPLVIIKGTLNCRDHRKMLIVDGRVAFSGGVNLADEYINRREKHGHWKDIGFKLTGEAVLSFTRMFAEFWNAFADERVPDGYLKPAEDETAQDGCVISYCDMPTRESAVSNELYIDLLSQAKESAWFFTPYLIPGEALLDAFVRAARRGVDVRIIMPGVPDKKLVYRMSRSFYPVLLNAGVKIYEYGPGSSTRKRALSTARSEPSAP